MCGKTLARALSWSIVMILFIGALLCIGFNEDRSSGTITGPSFSTIVMTMIGLSAFLSFMRRRIRG